MSCDLDPIPSKLLIECLDNILPSLTDLFNSSLASGKLPQFFKSAFVTPIIKNMCLHHNDFNNYRPVSNLCFISKILEKLVLSQVSSYLNSHKTRKTLIPYRRHIRLLESFHIRHHQLILGLRWWHKVTHSEIRSRAVIPSIKSTLLHRQLCWLGHFIRMSDSRMPHRVFYGQLILGHRSVGGQKKRFKDHIKSIPQKCNIPISWLEALASN